MKKSSCIFSCIFVIFVTSTVTACAQRNGRIVEQERAVSLRVLQERLRSCTQNGNCPTLLLNLAGLTKIKGYIQDDQNSDVILFGMVEPNAPPLKTGDFVVALRNAWLKYVTIKGNTRYYADPGCSIDPDPSVMKKLDKLGNEIVSKGSQDGVEKGIEKWRDTCKKPQNVRVLGIPANTHFAQVLVQADYYMKNLVNGSVQLEVDSFASVVDMTLASIKDDVVHNRPIAVQINPMNRFEFYPGENKYYQDDGIVTIEQCPVMLFTEIEYINRNGQTHGAGQADPIAQKFAEGFSKHYQNIAKKKPIYQELEGLFRFVALAKIMKHKNVNLKLDYFLEDFPVSEVSVDQTLPGISHVKNFEHRQDFDNGYQVLQLWLPSCGGVSIGIEVTPGRFIKKPTMRLAQLRKSILSKRSYIDALFWNL